MEEQYGYLSYLERPLDPAQEAICCRAENTIAAAGAGSGKTQVLATRFAWLVMSKEVPASKILTLTFTKKAAGEMYERIYQTLDFFARRLEGEPQFARERERAIRALDDFADVHIQTLDSYCAALVRQAANRYGIRPDFTSGSKDADQHIRDLALPFAISNRHRPAVQAFADPGRLQDFASDVLAATISTYASLADGDDFFSRHAAAQCGIIADGLNYLAFLGGIRPELLDDACGKLQEAKDAILEAYGQVPQPVEKEPCRAYYRTALSLCDLIDEIPIKKAGDGLTAEDIMRQSPAALSLCGTLAQIVALARRPAPKGLATTDKVRKAVNAFRDGTAAYLDALTAYVEHYPAIADLLQLLDEFSSAARDARLSSGSLSFRDIQKMALKILREQRDIREQEQAAYDKIMIDEFQDNNGENRDLLFLLAGRENAGGAGLQSRPRIEDITGGKLFFVGDEKQSIYKFRNADVSVFNTLQQEFSARFPGSVRWMTNNYRSSGPLLAAFNGLFGGSHGIFDGTLGMEEYPYEAHYEKPATMRNAEPAPPADGADVALHYCILNGGTLATPGRDYLPAREQEAYYIASTIDALLAAARGQERQPTIAILDKSRKDRGVITKWLNRFGITYTTDQQSSLFDAGPVYDIYTFLRLCVYPSDSNAYAAYLCSPFAGLREPSMETVLAVLAPADGSAFDPLRETFTADGGERSVAQELEALLPPAEYAKYRQAADFYRAERHAVLSRPLTETLARLWEGTGYRYETLLDATLHLYAEQYDMLFEMARTCDGSNKTAAWFVDQLALLKAGEGSWLGGDDELDVKNLSYPVEKNAAVEIMTIHKSKGLQFSHVFVCGCVGVAAKANTGRVFYEEGTGLSIRPESGRDNYFCLLQKRLERRKELAEFRRLIYVAITRAERQAYVVGTITPSKQAAGKAGAESGGDTDFKLLETQLNLYYPAWEAEEAGRLRYERGAPFTLYCIPPVERGVIRQARGGTAPDAGAARSAAQRSGAYAGTPTVTSVPEDIRKCPPSGMEDASLTGPRPRSARAEEYRARLAPLLASYRPQEAAAGGACDPDSGEAAERDGTELPAPYFTEADFGTLAHSYLEAAAKGVPPERYEPPLRLFKDIPPEHAETFRRCCIMMAEDFMAGPLGAALARARTAGRFHRAEYGFRTCLRGFMVTGSIDLLFQNEDGTYTLVDYKSDDALNVERYLDQQACYRLAAARLLRTTPDAVRCVLFFLRFNREVDVSAGIDALLAGRQEPDEARITGYLLRKSTDELVRMIAREERTDEGTARRTLEASPFFRRLRSGDERLFLKSPEYVYARYLEQEGR